MEIYNHISKIIDSYKLFNDYEIIIKIKPTIDGNPYNLYEIYDIDFKDQQSSNNQLNIQTTAIVNKVKKRMSEQVKYKKWKVFYLIKELIQQLDINTNFDFNYFRGQSQNWPALPGILRRNTNKELLLNFEQEYKMLSYNYPNELEYIEYKEEDLIERTKNLSILQHYGMKTSLLDITQNPYIALLFMVSENHKNKLKQPCIELYEIDEINHSKNHLFVRVQKDLNNKRIEAQQGAFLNYDRLYSLKTVQISPMNRIRILLDVDKSQSIKELEGEIENLKEIKAAHNDSENKMNNDTLYGFVDEHIKSLDFKLNRLTVQNINDCYEGIRKELLTKLTEFYYFENKLYPDLDKQIEFIQTKYSDASRKRYIANV